MARLQRAGQLVRRADSGIGEHLKQLADTSRNGNSRSFQMLASRSLSFDAEAAAVGIGRAAGTVGIAGAVGIVNGVLGEWRAVAAVGVTRRIGFVRVRAQLAMIISLLGIESWRVGGERIRRGLVAEGTAVGTEGIVDTVRFEWASGSEGIGSRVG